jgi:16S rRNA processing protein RimM
MAQDKRITLGHIGTAYGVKGWVKVRSYTDPAHNIFTYQPWQLLLHGEWQEVKLRQGKPYVKGLIAQLQGCDNRYQAEAYAGMEIAVAKDHLPQLNEDEYYWQQLTGLDVKTNTGIQLGNVNHLLATGANDVLVVQGNADSIDTNERLIPWLLNQVVTNVDLLRGIIWVDWDPEF